MSLNIDRSTWTRVALGDVAAASKEKVSPADGTVERYVAGEHMATDDLKIHRWGDVGEVDLGPAFHRRFWPGQVLYGSRRTYLRKVAVADFEGVCANTTFVVQSTDGEVLLQKFLPFVMSTEPFHTFAIAESKGSVNPYVNWSDIARYEFALPPLGEQKRIADLLWAIERAIQAAYALRYATAEARRVWTDERVAQFVDEACVPFREVWARSPESGWSVAPCDDDTGRFVLSLAALGPEGYRPNRLKPVPNSEKARAATLRRGDLLISRANTVDAVGRAGIFTEDRSDVSFPDTMMRITPIESVDPWFALAVTSSRHGRAHMRRSAAGSATSMVKINRTSLGRLAFPATPLDEQRAFMAEFGHFDHAVEEVDANVSLLTAVRRSFLKKILVSP